MNMVCDKNGGYSYENNTQGLKEANYPLEQTC